MAYTTDKGERRIAAAARTDWSQHWLIGVAILLGALTLAWLLAGQPAIIITGWL